MSSSDFEAAILLADISGSTPLYEEVGDSLASRHIGTCLDCLQGIVERWDGCYVRSRGDDVLAFFSDPSRAFGAVREIVSQNLGGPLQVHAGIHFGHVIQTRGDIYGDAVNVAARLSTLANPGEVLMSSQFTEQLSTTDRFLLRPLDTFAFKGKSIPTEVYSLLDADATLQPKALLGDAAGGTATLRMQKVSEVSLSLDYAEHSRVCRLGASLSMGRSSECDIIIARPWISRKHAIVRVCPGRAVQFSDRSSAGTYLAMGDEDSVFLRRETVLLRGSGIISPTLRPTDHRAEVIRYQVVSHEGE